MQVEISIGDPTPGNIPGYDSILVTFSNSGKTHTFTFFISPDRKTLARLETIDISQDLMSKINVVGRPVRGAQDAPVTVISFVDYQCPFCSRMHATIFQKLMQQYGNQVKFIYVDFPLVEIHPWAVRAAVDANCLAAQNATAYWNFVDYMYANQKAITGHDLSESFANLDKAASEQGGREQLNMAALTACIQKSDETKVRQSMAEGDKLGIDATPTTLVNGDKISGAVSEGSLRAVLDHALVDRSAGQPGARP